MGKWRAAALLAVHAVIALHIAHWLTAGSTVTPVEPSEAMAFGKAGVVNAGLIFFAAVILLTAVFGRFFCGWACHLVALQDFCGWLMSKMGIRPRPLRSRLLRVVPALAFFYMFLWPAAYRLWIGDSFRITAFEYTTSHFWSTFPGWVIGGLTFLTCGFACVYFLGAKGFCTYACPYGAIFAAADKVAPLRIRVTDACVGCGHCSSVCTSNVRVAEEVRDFKMVVDSGCMKCQDCINVCPTNALYLGFGAPSLFARPRVEARTPRRPVLSWGEEAILGVGFLTAFATFRGLYGMVPFLMALGLAGVLAYVVLTTVRLVRQRDVQRQGLALKSEGKLLPAGRGFVAVALLIAVFWAHSAAVRAQSFLGERSYAGTAALRQRALDPAAAPGGLTAADSALVGEALGRFERVRSWGLFDTYGAASKLSWLYFLAGSSERAADYARQALEQEEAPAEMHQLLARAALARGDLPVAISSYEQAIAAQPGAPQPYMALGMALAGRGELAAAGAVFDRGRRAVPGAVDLVYNAGLVRALQGQTDAAITLFQQALMVNPRYLPARENLAGVLASAGRYEESVAQYRAALEQAGNDSETRFLLARALVELGRRQEAEAELRRALAIDPGNENAQTLLAELHATGGEPRDNALSQDGAQ